ncbi:MAG: Shedu anti-phage system protein SduA domain-containing protein [Actinomycetota bacterium]
MAKPPEIKTAAEAAQEELDTDPLKEFFVWWDEISAQDVARLEARLSSAEREADMQRFLEAHPLMLIQHLGGGHGRWVLPSKALGSEFRTDFVVGERDSHGLRWVLVELESPNVPAFNKRGDASKYLNHALSQILHWRSWLERNQNYAARPRTDEGLGLTDIDTSPPGLILIGRRSSRTRHAAGLRRQLEKNHDVRIHSYDWLIEQAGGRVKSLAEHRSRLGAVRK